MSWGYRVLVILVLFLIGLGVMVYIAMQQHNEMVDENYYDKELKYQEVIDARKNVERLNDSVLVTSTDSVVSVKLPIAASQQVKDGSIEFLRPSDMQKDRTIVLQPDQQGIQLIPRTDFTKGLYRIRANWTSNGVRYYDERNVFLK